MKHKINLLIRKKGYLKKERIFLLFRKITLLMSGLILVATIIFFYLNDRIGKQTDNLIKKKSSYLNKIVESKDVEAKLIFIQNKTGQVEKFVDQDVNFLKYYTIIQQTIDSSIKDNDSTTSAILINDFNLDNERSTHFSLAASDFNTYIKLLNYVESEKFLNLFSDLTLAGFNYTALTKKGYVLNFKGHFSPEYEKVN